VDNALVAGRQHFLFWQLQHVQPRLKLIAHLAVVKVVADDVSSIYIILLQKLDLEFDIFSGHSIWNSLVSSIKQLLDHEVDLRWQQRYCLVFDESSGFDFTKDIQVALVLEFVCNRNSESASGLFLRHFYRVKCFEETLPVVPRTDLLVVPTVDVDVQ